MAKEISIFILTDSTGNVRSVAKSLDHAVKDVIQFYIPTEINKFVEWGGCHTYGLLYQYWHAMKLAGWEYTKRTIEI